MVQRYLKNRVLMKKVLLILGLLIVFGTHISIIAMGLPQNLLGGHATLNIIAGLLIVAGSWEELKR